MTDLPSALNALHRRRGFQPFISLSISGEAIGARVQCNFLGPDPLSRSRSQARVPPGGLAAIVASRTPIGDISSFRSKPVSVWRSPLHQFQTQKLASQRQPTKQPLQQGNGKVP